MLRFIALCLLIGAVFLPCHAEATLLAIESFEYAAGTNLGASTNGGWGWNGAWSATYGATFPIQVQTGTLGPYPGLVTSGNHLQTWAVGDGTSFERFSRTLQTPIPDSGQEIWWSFQIGLYAAKNASIWTLPGLVTTSGGTTPASVFTTNGNALPATLRFGTTTVITGNSSYTPHLVLLKIQMSGNASAETLTCYVDPNLSQASSTWTGITNSTSFFVDTGITGVNWDGGRASSAGFANDDVLLDEIRFATTWQDAVQAVPEPAVPLWARLGLGGAVVLGDRGRRCRFRATRWRGRPVPTAPPSPTSHGHRSAAQSFGG